MKILSFITVASIFFFSCRKDKDEQQVPLPEAEQTYPDYAMLTPGNYWIYERYIVDTNGIATPTQIFDSCFVEKDTVINNTTYAKVYRLALYDPQKSYSFQRDSLHYIVDVSGRILFSSMDTNVFESRYILGPGDTVCYVERRMKDLNYSVTVPAGTYLTSDARETYYLTSAYAMWGNERSIHVRYAKNVGIVKETLPFFISAPGYTERQLVRFHVQ